MAFARHLGLDKMVVEGDSLTVIKKALSSYFDLSPIDFIIQSKDYEENTFWVEDGPEQIYRHIEEDRYYLYAE
ncbi:hypothetical protein Gotur_035739 [Gossypium turneri]